MTRSFNWRRRSINVLAAGLLGALALPASNAAAKDIVMKLSTPTMNDMQHEWANLYKEALEKRTAGRIKVQVFPAAQLGPIASVLQGLQLGSIEATLTPYEFYIGVDPRFQVPGMPGLYTSMEDAQAKLTHPKVREQLMDIGKSKGIVGLSSVVYGPQIFVSRRPIKTLADFNRQKLRVLASDIEIETVKDLGASAVPMPLNEVSSALQQGAIDGTNSLYDVLVPQKTYSFAPHVVDTGLWYTVVYASVSAAWLNTLPADLQKAVLDTAKELEPVIFSRELERQKTSKQQWLANKGTIVQLSEAEQKTAQAKARAVTDKVLARNSAQKALYELIKSTPGH